MKGDKGTNGDKGDLGLKGVKGDKGDKGTEGEKGDKGTKGASGAKGSKGDKGIKGDKGQNAEKGDKGTKGSKGQKGSGEKGAKGVKGANAEKGIDGIKGNKGDKGDLGEKGVKGDKGSKGNEGLKGSKGTEGSKGDEGSKGTQGKKGIQGVKGVKGSSPFAQVTAVVSSKRGLYQDQKEENMSQNSAKEGKWRNSPLGTIYQVNINNPALFVEGEEVYISGAGYFQIASIQGQVFTLVLTSLGEGDTGVVVVGEKVVPSGARGPRGKTGKPIAVILDFRGDYTGREYQVLLDSSRSIVLGATVYVESLGYFLVSQYDNKRGEELVKRGEDHGIFTLRLIYSSLTDSGVMRKGLRLITSGARGPRGRQGAKGVRGPSATVQRKEQSYLLLHSSLSESIQEQNRRGEEKAYPLNATETLYVELPEGKLSSPLRNREISPSSGSLLFSQSCPPGTKLVSGACSWNLLKTKREEMRSTWCRASDFSSSYDLSSNKRDSEMSFQTVEEQFEGREEQVLSSISFKSERGEQEEVEMNSNSCQVLPTRSADDKDMKECGMFCLFQKTEPVYEGENRFSCKYMPPSLFGANELSSILPSMKRSEQSLEENVQMVTVELVCEDI